ncbi:ryncolin-4 [Drosophila eugracilis]|uniref:ryncolin-4 n=1 Tax=Drosophila eugracilis TaxID=29029 RepID=UPI0007E86485|nr:ryncolin-4 [Drosophila eugracilis]
MNPSDHSPIHNTEESSQESTTDNNVLSSHSLMESNGELVQELQSNINDLDQKMTDVVKSITSLKQRNIIVDKEDTINSLKAIEPKINQMQSDINELKKLLDSTKNLNLSNFSKEQNDKPFEVSGPKDFEAVFQDIPSAGMGWMIIQRRFDGSVSFNEMQLQYEISYKNGFGDLRSEFWIGCEKLHLLTTSRRHELYIQLKDFDNVTSFARYDNFVIGSGYEGYCIKSLGTYSGNAGDALSASLGKKFIHQRAYYESYDASFRWSWWGETPHCNLNGFYHRSKINLTDLNGIWWGYTKQKRYSLRSCKMLIRPKLDF